MVTNSTFQKRLAMFLAAVLLAGATFVTPSTSEVQAAAFALFHPAVQYSTGTLPGSAAVGDFNNDGRPDLAVANAGGGTVSVLLNDAGGSFLGQATYPAGNNPSAVTVSDLNTDGRLDLAVTNAGSGTVSVLLKNAGSGFLAQVTYPVGNSPSAVAPLDFNSDGQPDLAVANAASGTVTLLRNDGTGAFVLQDTYPVGDEPLSLVTGDFNRDGFTDLAAANASGDSISVLVNTGSGGFQPQVSYTAGSRPVSLSTVDLDVDGDLDLVAANESSDSVSLLYNSDGVFQSPLSYTVGDAPRSVAVGDFFRNGRMDLAVANMGSDTISVLRSSGGEITVEQVDYPVGDAPSAVVVADFNGDGQPDLAVTNQDSGTASLLRNASPNCFDGVFQDTASYPAGVGLRVIAAGDFDNDGYPDLAAANTTDDTVSVLRNDGSGSFEEQVVYAVGNDPVGLAAADLNNDGRVDLVTGNFTADSVSILLNDGSGGFQGQVEYLAGDTPIGVSVADFNTDGKQDLVVANYDASSVYVLLNQGGGVFSQRTRYRVQINPSTAAVGDFNRDGSPDLAVPNYSSDSVSVLLNNGSGGFGAAANYAVGDGPAAVVAADLNGDGRLDLATTNYYADTLSLLLNNGSGAFSLQSPYPVEDSPYALTTGDFNRDGRPDLAVTHKFINSVLVLQNNGQAAFQTLARYTVGSYPRSISTEDFNQDGRPDLSTGDSLSDQVSVALNQASDTGSLDIHSLGSGAWHDPATWLCRVPAAGDTVTIDPGHTVTLDSDSALENLTIDGALEVSGGSNLTVSGSWTTNGAFNPGDGVVTFSGSGEQLITGDMEFHDLVVGSDAVLTTSSAVTLSGALTNQGWISETKAVGGAGSLSYGLGGISLDVTNPGTLASLQVMRRDANHPAGPAGQQTGRYWSLSTNPSAAGFSVNLTLPVSFDPTGADRVCRYTGAGWDCAQSSAAGSAITRAGVTQFSDWTVLRNEASTLALAASTNSAFDGHAVTFTATVSAASGTPSGTVSFYDGPGLLGSAALDGSGVAVYTSSALSTGAHTIRAEYSGTGIYLPSSAAVVVSVVPEVIFSDGFESGDLSAWTSSVTDGGDLSVTAAAALVGSRGIQAVIDDNTPIYVTDDTPNAERRYRARFYFDPNSITMASGDGHYLLMGYYGTTSPILYVQLYYSSTAGYQMRMYVRMDSGSFLSTDLYPIADAPHAIEFDWQAASATGANDGHLTFWIDGTERASLTGIDNDTYRLDRVQFGAVSSIDTGTRGTCFFDAFASGRADAIGFEGLRADFSASPTLGAAPLVVTFTNLTLPLDAGSTYLWDFGDGSTSTDPSPTHTYSSYDSFTVSLTVNNASRGTDSETKTGYIQVVEPIFSDGFESGNLSAWTSSVTDDGDLSVTAAAALVGSRGMQAVIDDNTSIYVTDDTPNAERRYRARFYFDPNSITMASGDGHYLLMGYYGTTSPILYVQLYYSSTAGYQMRMYVRMDSGSFLSTDLYPIADAPHAIEFDWQAASATGANDGHLTFWIDGTERASITGIDNDTYRLDRVRLGAVSSIDTGTRGTCFFDAFASGRADAIGFEGLRADFSASPTLGAAPLVVTFTNLTLPLDAGSTYLWDFGDGSTSTDPSPTHTYSSYDSFTVSLTVNNASRGTDSETKTGYIQVVEPIFSDGFESGDLSAWTSSVTDDGDLSVTAAAALVGSRGMQAVIDDNTPIYVTDDTPNAERRYRARFYFDPNSITMASGDGHYLLMGYYGTTSPILYVQLYYSSTAGYQMRMHVRMDSGSFLSTGLYPIADAPHAIEFDWQAASATGANDGHLTFWIDGTERASITGIDNDTYRLDRVQFGAVSSIDTGTRGTCIFDAFASGRAAYIGSEQP